LDERVTAVAVEEALRRRPSGQERQFDRRPAIERELSLLHACERHITEAIARGEPMEPLLAQLH
jgi:hypothetical protein